MFALFDPRPPTSEAQRVARRQLRRVMVALGLLDLLTLAFVLIVFAERGPWGLSNDELFAVVVVGLGGVLGTRIAMAFRLHRRGGELFSSDAGSGRARV